MNPVIIIGGPTSSGKTDLAKIIVNKYNAVALSVDSRQIYQGLDIGSGKDKSFHQEMIDIVSPPAKNKSAILFSVAEFQQKALSIINKIHKENKIPILVGGTGYYIDSLLYNLNYPQAKNDKLTKQLEKLSLQDLENRLKKLDKSSFLRCQGNKRKVIRALEIISITKKPVAKQIMKPRFKSIIIILNPPFENLKIKIKNRLKQRLRAGLVTEVEKLRKITDSGWLENLGLDYKFANQYLDNKISLVKMENKIYTANCQYARRQVTWFKKYKSAIWVENAPQALKFVRMFINSLKSDNI